MTPRFIPFEAMTDAEQREHLWLMHRCPLTHEREEEPIDCHEARERYGASHTHDKPTRRDT